jgi:hypothetical protein
LTWIAITFTRILINYGQGFISAGRAGGKQEHKREEKMQRMTGGRAIGLTPHVEYLAPA